MSGRTGQTKRKKKKEERKRNGQEKKKRKEEGNARTKNNNKKTLGQHLARNSTDFREKSPMGPVPHRFTLGDRTGQKIETKTKQEKKRVVPVKETLLPHNYPVSDTAVWAI